MSRQNQIFTEAFVEEIIIDVVRTELDERIKQGDLDTSINSEMYLKAPHNSAIIRVLSSGKQKRQEIAYPLFPPHLLLPINVGDHVWTLTLAGQTYWVSRKNYDSTVDDLSVVYPDREVGADQFNDDTAAQHDRAKTEKSILPRIVSSIKSVFKDDEDEYINKLKENRKIVSEVVPRFKKRPGDLVFQGSNNTLISLGSDRGFKKEDPIDLATPSSALDVPERYTGTIDLVTGRGRYHPLKSTSESATGDVPSRTAPPVIQNAMGEEEVDKDPLANEIAELNNRSEGDPDFFCDASRIYVSSKTKVDENFSLKSNYPKIPAVITAAIGDVPFNIEGAAIVLKSDEIRLIARRHVAAEHADIKDTKAVDVNGSIKIVKEGTRGSDGHSATDGNGAAVIALQPDGTIMIDGPTIVIGTGREEANGSGNQVFIGAGATESLVLGDSLKLLLDNYFDAMGQWILTKFDAHIHPTGVGPSGTPVGFTGFDGGTGDAKKSTGDTLSKVGKTK